MLRIRKFANFSTQPRGVTLKETRQNKKRPGSNIIEQ